ncbi:MAG: hypothetical protein ACREIA_17730 [Opitutaceae bacterium]
MERLRRRYEADLHRQAQLLAFPVTPPDMRVRIRRFGEAESDRFPDSRGFDSGRQEDESRDTDPVPTGI